MSYRDRLRPWAIARLLHNKLQWSIIDRYRTKSDAEGHLQWWREHVPETKYEVIWDLPTEDK
ncbi:MAG: hypothetical protein F6K36_20240 [Symploca sp. SIO3C6]|uniref:Uncharacterized protein n=1 Tax=Symploca sp. SIO1C4 TaxID=2607765 RepID=A0A6B3NI60_9CYAN|nr:hypothetical protein [Symploca sp. SIO3C6]NER31447.1 hypothetical protein [Symploca sp. SIO1C4]NET06731.1 hypothetical protein [Symploca sp. SIO2B6]